MAGRKPTFASVTTKPCKCGWAQNVAAEPYNSVVFDSDTNEYQFRTPKGGSLAIYHCPFCGGVMPRSKRAELFAYINEAERNRLASLTAGVNSVADAIRVFGKPQHDHPRGLVVQTPAKGRRPPSVASYRVLRFTRASDTADVELIDYGPQGVRVQLRAKYLGRPRRPRTKR